MWFGTDHTPTKLNLNLLWAFPPHILAAFMIFNKKYSLFIKKYLLTFAVINLILSVTMWFLLPQQYDIAIFPILLILVVRFGTVIFKN